MQEYEKVFIQRGSCPSSVVQPEEKRSFNGTNTSVFLSINITRIGALMEREIFQNWFHMRFVQSLSFDDRINTESSIAATQRPFSSKREHTDF